MFGEVIVIKNMLYYSFVLRYTFCLQNRWS